MNRHLEGTTKEPPTYHTIAWITSSLVNDEVSSNDEMVDYYVQESAGEVSRKLATYLVGKRGEFMGKAIQGDIELVVDHVVDFINKEGR